MLDYEKSNVLRSELYTILDSNKKAREYFHDHQYYFFDDYKKLLWNDVTNIFDGSKNISDLDEYEKNDLMQNIFLLNNMDQLDNNYYLLVRLATGSQGEFIPVSYYDSQDLLNFLKAL